MSSIEDLLVQIKESLQREIGGLHSEMREGFAQVNTRLDTQSVRLERQAGLWQTGARWSARMDTVSSESLPDRACLSRAAESGS